METAEHTRLAENERREKHWRRWGPYLSERQWGTVREDYSAEQDPWSYLPHEHARSYAYRWGEDGLFGVSDNHQRLCFALAFWNGKDPILKERLFGLSNHEGNHGEDVKECYWFEDNTPTHSYMRGRYRYPQEPFPYAELVAANARQGLEHPEFELVDTGIFDENRYFDVVVEYAKAGPEDLLIRITVENRGPEAAVFHLLPTLWFRNTWSWAPGEERPVLRGKDGVVEAIHPTLGNRCLTLDGDPDFLFTENETNRRRLYDAPNRAAHVKDAFHYAVVYGDAEAAAIDGGTKWAGWYRWDIPAGERRTTRLRLAPEPGVDIDTHAFDDVIRLRRKEADAFYGAIMPRKVSKEEAAVFRQAMAGMFWSKQWYHYVVETWLRGDPTEPPPPPGRFQGRNHEWVHLYNDDVLSMPDTWEFPWYATWDSAFHALPLAMADPEYAKRQLTLLTREWYMHPNGQLPAYEWDFNDVNPPVHAWALWEIYDNERRQKGEGDTAFLESVFHKLLMNFTWWVNRKDVLGQNVFEGGFLGMDNIGVFDRSSPPPTGGRLEQSDATSWMAMYCLDMLAISWELSKTNLAYEDIASKFFEHFLYIADAIHNIKWTGRSLWDEEDGFFYDQIRYPDGTREPIRLRSMVGLIPLLAVEILDPRQVDQLPGFKRRMEWFYEHRGDLTSNITCRFEPGEKGRCLLALMRREQLERVLTRVFDEDEFLSPYGIRSLSKVYENDPYVFARGDFREVVRYEPAEARNPLFGGNSNWRGPVWAPMNFLIIRALERYHRFWGDELTVEVPTGSGRRMPLDEAAKEIGRRLIKLFTLDENSRRPFLGEDDELQADPEWRDRLLFHEYFNGDNGAGLGASHQTGWTGLVANLIAECRKDASR